MDLKGHRIILASGSPRRRELLAGLNVDFEVDTGNSFDEVYAPGTPSDMIPSLMSEGKSFGFHRELFENEILVTSDTLVICPEGDIVMGKPKDRDDAFRMLRILSGRSHKVITAVTVRTLRGFKTLSDTAVVHFKHLSDDEIFYYIDNFKPYDKAGAYGIQEWIGYMGIDRIEGSFYTIMGFPVHLVYDMLKEVL